MNDVILLLLVSWVIPLGLFVFYAVTTPVPGTAWRRRLMPRRTIRPVTWILVSQKITLILIVAFIALVRAIGDFPGRDWVALSLYTLLPALAWVVFRYLRRLQSDHERALRRGEDPKQGDPS